MEKQVNRTTNSGCHDAACSSSIILDRRASMSGRRDLNIVLKSKKNGVAVTNAHKSGIARGWPIVEVIEPMK